MIGQTLGHYRVLEKLGAGGMGEVYRVRDTRLGRDVALKILPAELTSDATRVHRFQQEASAASALNHPHIVALFDTGCCDSTHFIAMELIEGQPLTEWVKRARPDLARILDVITQVADALDAAHRAGILHRDIKPANLLVTAQGYAKVVDFGLAKLTEAATGDATQSFATEAGAVMGTAAYMSPEQALGKPLDARTDVFSLGAVLYEAVTGQRAFSGTSGVDALHAVVHAAPQPVSELAPRAPAELRWVLDKALAKDPDERYQSMREFAADLRRLRRRLDSGESATGIAAVEAPPAPQTSRWLYAAAGAAVMLVALAALLAVPAVRVRLQRGMRSSTLLEGITMTPLTRDPSYEGEAVFSPDGETIAYVSDRSGNFEIYLRQVSGGPDLNLTNNPADDVQPAFSPDGKRIAFVSSREGGSEIFYRGVDNPVVGGDLWVMAALGGTPQRIAREANFPSWSPDGSTIIYSTGEWFTQKIMRVSPEGGEPREIPIQFPSDLPPPLWFYPSYSHDARWILLEAGELIWLVPAEGGRAQRIVPGRHPVWSADGNAVFYGNPEAGKNGALWRVPVSLETGRAAGPAEPLTVGGPSLVRDASPSPDGTRIVVTEFEATFNIEEIPFDAEAGRVTGSPRGLTRGRNAIFFKGYSGDGRSVLYSLPVGPAFHIWRVTDGGPPSQITLDARFSDDSPHMSPDGRTIAFVRGPAGQQQATPALWLMDADGTNPRKLVESAVSCGWLPDNRALIYFSFRDRQIYHYSSESRESRRLTDERGAFQICKVSADGQWVVYQFANQARKVELHAVPTAGGPSRVVAALDQRSTYHPSFSPSGRWLYFQPTHKNMYRVPGPAQGWRAAPAEKCTNFPESGLFLEDPVVSPDGHHLLYSRGHITADLWLLRLAP